MKDIFEVGFGVAVGVLMIGVALFVVAFTFSNGHFNDQVKRYNFCVKELAASIASTTPNDDDTHIQCYNTNFSNFSN